MPRRDEQPPDDQIPEDLESLVEEKVQEYLDGSDRGMTRRGWLGLLGAGTVGLGIANASSSTDGESRRAPVISSSGSVRDFEVADLTAQTINAEHLFANRIDASDVNGVRVAENAAEIQQYLDELDGEKTGYDDSGKAQRPGGGVVLLKRKKYTPTSTITLRTGVHLAGIQPERRQGKSNHTWSYSIISGEDVPQGNPVIEAPADTHHVTVRDLIITGSPTGRNVTGVKIDNSPNSWMDRVQIQRCKGHGYWVRGGLDTYVTNCNIEGGSLSNSTYAVLIESEDDSVGSGSNDTQIKMRGGRVKSGGLQGDGNTAIRMESALLHAFRLRLSTLNGNDPNVPVVYNSDSGTPMMLSGISISGHRQAGVHGIENNGNMHLANSRVEKMDVGIIENGRSNSQFSNTRVKQCRGHGIKITGVPPAYSGLLVRDNGGDGIRFSGGQAFNPWVNVRVTGNGGWGLNVADVRSGDVPYITGFAASSNALGPLSDPSAAWIRSSRTYRNEASGRALKSGDGTTQTFSVTHGMDEAPQFVQLSPLSSAASSPWYVSDRTSSEFAITFTTAPPSGTDNVRFEWWSVGESATPK